MRSLPSIFLYFYADKADGARASGARASGRRASYRRIRQGTAIFFIHIYTYQRSTEAQNVFQGKIVPEQSRAERTAGVAQLLARPLSLSASASQPQPGDILLVRAIATGTTIYIQIDVAAHTHTSLCLSIHVHDTVSPRLRYLPQVATHQIFLIPSLLPASSTA